MKVWLTCVFVLYGMVEIYQWMKHFTLPLPVFILGGAALAIASNYGKYAGWSFQKQATTNTEAVKPLPETNLTNWANLQTAATTLPQPSKPVSFTIPSVKPKVVNDNQTLN